MEFGLIGAPMWHSHSMFASEVNDQLRAGLALYRTVQKAGSPTLVSGTTIKLCDGAHIELSVGAQAGAAHQPAVIRGRRIYVNDQLDIRN